MHEKKEHLPLKIHDTNKNKQPASRNVHVGMLIEWGKSLLRLPCDDVSNIWRLSKNNGTPKWMVYNFKTLLTWMIWGYHYFWKHPYGGYLKNRG